MLASKAATLIICIVFVASVAVFWSHVASVTSPNPSTTQLTTDTPTCSPSPSCNGFTILSANLTVVVSEDITSQELTLAISASGSMSISKLQVYFGNAVIGNVTGPFLPGYTKSVGVAVPTTINVTTGQYYRVFVEAIYTNPSNGNVVGDYWQSAFAFAQ